MCIYIYITYMIIIIYMWATTCVIFVHTWLFVVGMYIKWTQSLCTHMQYAYGLGLRACAVHKGIFWHFLGVIDVWTTLNMYMTYAVLQLKTKCLALSLQAYTFYIMSVSDSDIMWSSVTRNDLITNSSVSCCISAALKGMLILSNLYIVSIISHVVYQYYACNSLQMLVKTDI